MNETVGKERKREASYIEWTFSHVPLTFLLPLTKASIQFDE